MSLRAAIAVAGSPPLSAVDDIVRRDWLRLIRAENIGPITCYQLLARYGSAARAIAAIPHISRRAAGKNIVLPTIAQADDEIASHHKIGARLLLAIEPDYPQLLTHISDAPPVLSVRGKADLLNQKTLAIVGTRNASAAGRKFTETMAVECGRSGYVIVSGLARGIDGCAHRAALPFGTIAVMAGGVDVIYPPEHESLYRDICEHGVAVSEIPIGTEPQARHFPRRNRIISGLSMGTVVIEAALKSGSLITAQYALDHNREVFAVPGSPMDPRCAGPNSLIKQGAHLTENAGDIIAVLRQIRPDTVRQTAAAFESQPAYSQNDADIESAMPSIIELLGPTPMPIDDIIHMAQIPASIVLSVLLELELAGRLQRFAGNKVALFYI